MHSLLPWIGLVGARLCDGDEVLAVVRRARGERRPKYVATICRGLRNTREFNTITAATRWAEKYFTDRVD